MFSLIPRNKAPASFTYSIPSPPKRGYRIKATQLQERLHLWAPKAQLESAPCPHCRKNGVMKGRLFSCWWREWETEQLACSGNQGIRDFDCSSGRGRSEKEWHSSWITWFHSVSCFTSRRAAKTDTNMVCAQVRWHHAIDAEGKGDNDSSPDFRQPRQTKLGGESMFLSASHCGTSVSLLQRSPTIYLVGFPSQLPAISSSSRRPCAQTSGVSCNAPPHSVHTRRRIGLWARSSSEAYR